MISKIISEELVKKTQEAIEQVEKITIVAHMGPDGDAVGSALALYHFLLAIEKKPTVILPNDFPDFLAWMPDADKILIYEKEQRKANAVFAQSELIFALDFNTLSRLGPMKKAITASSAYKILIDHHPEPDDFTNVVISHPELSSTSELIFRLICRMEQFPKINLACAECIYTGMMTDTGNFSYNSKHQDVYSIIFNLVKTGLDTDEIYRKVYNTYSSNRLKLMGYCLYKKMKIYPQYQTALITLTKNELLRFGYKVGDAEGLVNIPLSIKGINFSVFMREESDKIKISLRSQGTFPTNKVASDLFNGGGHLNASGGESYISLRETIKKFEAALPDYKDFL